MNATMHSIAAELVKAYNEMDEETAKRVEDNTDNTYTRYDKMNCLLLIMEADKLGIEPKDLPDEFCDEFDALGQEWGRLLLSLDATYKKNEAIG